MCLFRHILMWLMDFKTSSMRVWILIREFSQLYNYYNCYSIRTSSILFNAFCLSCVLSAFFFPFPILYCVDWIFFCWFESYIFFFLWLVLTYYAPHLTSLLSCVLRVSAPSCLSLLSLCWSCDIFRAGFHGGTAALFICHLVQNWTRLIQGYPRRDSPAQQEFGLSDH